MVQQVYLREFFFLKGYFMSFYVSSVGILVYNNDGWVGAAIQKFYVLYLQLINSATKLIILHQYFNYNNIHLVLAMSQKSLCPSMFSQSIESFVILTFGIKNNSYLML